MILKECTSQALVFTRYLNIILAWELRRNKVKGKYIPCIAQEKYEMRIYKQELLKIEKSPTLLKYIINAMIRKKWSPDAIAGKLKLDNNISCCISTESIYRFVYTSQVAAKLKLYSIYYLKDIKGKKGEKGVRAS